MGAIHTVCLRSWKVLSLLAQGPSTAPALAGAEAVSGCTSKHCWPKTPKISVPGRKLILDPHFPTWHGSVLRQVAADNSCWETVPSREWALQPFIPALVCSLPQPPPHSSLSPTTAWAGQTNKGASLLCHPDAHDSSLRCPYTHPGISALLQLLLLCPVGCPPLWHGRKASGVFNWEL